MWQPSMKQRCNAFRCDEGKWGLSARSFLYSRRVDGRTHPHRTDAPATLSHRARLRAPARSVADVCLLNGHLKRSMRLHGMWNQTGSFCRGLGSTRRFHLLLVVQVGSRLWLMHHVSLCQRPTPTGELQRDPVWVLKVNGPYKGVLVGLSGQILIDTRSVRVIDDLGDGNALRPELVAIGLNLVARHIQRDVIHGADGRAPCA